MAERLKLNYLIYSINFKENGKIDCFNLPWVWEIMLKKSAYKIEMGKVNNRVKTEKLKNIIEVK